MKLRSYSGRRFFSSILSGAIILFGSCEKSSLTDAGEHVSGGSISSGNTFPSVNGVSGTAYFSQDFNSSTNYLDYKGSGSNKITEILCVGNTTVNATGNSLQFVKNGGTGTNRGGFTKTSLIDGPANFLKWSMDIAISNNSQSISSGFAFAVGEISNTQPAAPGNTSIHSRIFINPTATTGEFVVAGESKTSSAFSGSQKLIWYINNTGNSAGYLDPNGELNSVENDAYDLWLKPQNGPAVHVIDDDVALTATVRLSGFKLYNNPNFTATIDVDNMELVEEPVIVIPKIVNVASVPAFSVPYRTSLDLAQIDRWIEVTYDNGNKEMARLQWSSGAVKYNGYQAGTYPIVGNIIANAGTANPQKLGVQTTITVKSDIKIPNAFTPNNDGKNDTWLVPELKNYRNYSIEVYDRNGVLIFSTSNADEGWDGKNSKGQIVAGVYNYVIKVPDISFEKRAGLTVIK